MPLSDCMLLLKPHVKKEALADLVARVGKHVNSRNGVLTDIKSLDTVHRGYGIQKLDGRCYQQRRIKRRRWFHRHELLLHKLWGVIRHDVIRNFCSFVHKSILTKSMVLLLVGSVVLCPDPGKTTRGSIGPFFKDQFYA
ncbi:hypothetical protein K2173_017771 [Erythroxylum novogranatense]|uniref:Uncharacterized protein n=1 Tax=Erythroxylum novogranatense TaxID=1862640 RepID=A0AAV8SMB2_9ROSI|nr:hypothetical protein K2173_017771 [Erythroxylum novogranatense]